MVSMTYATVHSPLHLDTNILPAAATENLIDLAIDCLNLLGSLEIPNMTGTAESKTVTVTERQRGAIQVVVRALYYSFYRGMQSSTAGGIAVTPVDVFGNAAMLRFIQEIADKLRVDEGVNWRRSII